MDFGQPFGGLIMGIPGAVLSALLRTSAPLTGRQIHRLIDTGHSLFSTQQILHTLTDLGIVEVTSVGRATQHVLNLDHYAVAPLRVLLNPIGALRTVVKDSVDEAVQLVLQP
jgi:hypothetical protein